MKTTQYVKKYRLKESAEFDHKRFVADFEKDINEAIEKFSGKDSSEISEANFKQITRKARNKWNGINNKTVGVLPESLWNFIYATVIKKKEEQYFPRKREVVV